MADRPILFSGPMIRALLDGRKTQTRRIIKPQPPADVVRHCWYSAPIYGFTKDHDVTGDWHKVRMLAYKGDRLWVRETWQALSFGDYQPTKSSQSEVRFAATDPCADLDAETRGYPWRPSIFMPRWASRLTLTVTDVRVERLQDISAEDAEAEGVWCDIDGWRDYLMPCTQCCATAVHSYRTLWDSINGPGSWQANPWVVA